MAMFVWHSADDIRQSAVLLEVVERVEILRSVRVLMEREINGCRRAERAWPQLCANVPETVQKFTLAIF